MNEEVAAVGVENDEAKVSLIVKEFEFACLVLREALDLSYHVLRVRPVLHLVLRELIVHLVQYVLSGGAVREGLSRDEDGRLRGVSLARREGAFRVHRDLPVLHFLLRLLVIGRLTHAPASLVLGLVATGTATDRRRLLVTTPEEVLLRLSLAVMRVGSWVKHVRAL